MEFRYPANDYQRLEPLKSNLGTSWTYVKDGSLFDELMLARGQVELQSCKDVDMLLRCASIETTPIYRTVLWYPLVLHKYEGKPLCHRVPGNLITAPLATSGISKSTAVLINGIDFTISNGMIQFTEDPFDNSAFHQDQLVDEHANTTTTITLWLANAQFDENYLYRFWGVQENLVGKSSYEYRELINSVSRAIMFGTSIKDVEEIVALLNSAPLCKEDGEIVEVCSEDNAGAFVATNKHVYRGVSGAVAAVAVDEVLSAGRPIFDTISFKQDIANHSLVCTLNNGQTPESLMNVNQHELLRNLTSPYEVVVIQRN